MRSNWHYIAPAPSAHHCRTYIDLLCDIMDKSLIFPHHLQHVSRLEMHVSVCVIHRPLFLATFHLSCYIGVRYLPPALSLCVCGPNELKVLTGFAWMWVWLSLSVSAERSSMNQLSSVCLARLHRVFFCVVCINRYNDIAPDSVLKGYCTSCTVCTPT